MKCSTAENKFQERECYFSLAYLQCSEDVPMHLCFNRSAPKPLLTVLRCPGLRRWWPVMDVNDCNLGWKAALVLARVHKGVKYFVLHLL